VKFLLAYNRVEWFNEKIFNLATSHFHKWYGLACSIILTWIFSLSVYKYLLPGNDWFDNYLIVVAVISLIMIVAWGFYKYKFPNRKKNKIGVVVAVHVESREDYVLYENDFLKPFKEKLSNLKSLFHIITIKNHQSENIIDEEDASRILERTKAQFIVWGSVKCSLREIIFALHFLKSPLHLMAE